MDKDKTSKGPPGGFFPGKSGSGKFGPGSSGRSGSGKDPEKRQRQGASGPSQDRSREEKDRTREEKDLRHQARQLNIKGQSRMDPSSLGDAVARAKAAAGLPPSKPGAALPPSKPGGAPPPSRSGGASPESGAPRSPGASLPPSSAKAAAPPQKPGPPPAPGTRLPPPGPGKSPVPPPPQPPSGLTGAGDLDEGGLADLPVVILPEEAPVAEAVSSLPEASGVVPVKPSMDEEPFAALLPISPRRAFAYWRCDPESVLAGRTRIGDADAILVLGIKDVTAIEFDGQRAFGGFEAPVYSPSGNYYFNDLFPGRSYQAALGLRASSGLYHELAATSIIETPKEWEPSRQEVQTLPIAGAAGGKWKPRFEPPLRREAGAEAWLAGEKSAAEFPAAVGEPVLDDFPADAESPGARSRSRQGKDEKFSAVPVTDASEKPVAGERFSSSPEKILAAALHGGVALEENASGNGGGEGAGQPSNGNGHHGSRGEGFAPGSPLPAGGPGGSAAEPIFFPWQMPRAEPGGHHPPPGYSPAGGPAMREAIHLELGSFHRSTDPGAGFHPGLPGSPAGGAALESERTASSAGLPSSADLISGRLPGSASWNAGALREAGGPSSLGLLALVEGAPRLPQNEAEAHPGPKVSLELNAEVIVYGRCSDPQTAVFIEGRRVPVRSDGTFDVRFALNHNGDSLK